MSAGPARRRRRPPGGPGEPAGQALSPCPRRARAAPRSRGTANRMLAIDDGTTARSRCASTRFSAAAGARHGPAGGRLSADSAGRRGWAAARPAAAAWRRRERSLRLAAERSRGELFVPKEPREGGETRVLTRGGRGRGRLWKQRGSSTKGGRRPPSDLTRWRRRGENGREGPYVAGGPRILTWFCGSIGHGFLTLALGAMT